MNLIETQTGDRQEPFDFMSVRVADEKKNCILVPYNFAINENMVGGLGFEITLPFLITPGTWSKRPV